MQKIKEIAFRLGEHPIHIKMFLLHCKECLKLINDEIILDKYAQFKKDSPKPFVKWVGGKRQLLLQFRSRNLFPPEEFNPLTAIYHEPFVGGGAMFFDLKPKKAILSDMNAELVITYNVIKNDVENLIKKLNHHKSKNNKEYFLKIRAKDVNKLTSLDVAARFIYLNRTCFNGLFRVNSSGGFNVPYGKNKNPMICDEENLRKVSKSLRGIRIIHEDYKKVLDRAKKGDFVYFDPPYYPVNKTSSFTSYTKEAFLEKEQMELSSTFLELHNRGCYVMLSNSNTPFIRELYRNLGDKIKIKKVYATRAINSVASKRGEIKE
ncbi:MAG: DNA adenine methylase, partial [Bacteroidales bacterium]|nr:DNA adenine methylase [Bacteroidales bacterium]